VESTREASETFICSVCRATLSATERDGKRARCKPCRRKYEKQWRDANPELTAQKRVRQREWRTEWATANAKQIAARHAIYRANHKEQQSALSAAHYVANRDEHLARGALWRAKNSEEIAAYQSAYRIANRARGAERDARYKARRRGAAIYEQGVSWRSVASRDGMDCAYCGVTCSTSDGSYGTGRGGVRVWKCGPTYPTLDHVVPLSRGGDHSMTNAALACYRCNSSKGARLLA
jgi:5-methylcytosine-specific restriction endonuclease McrA